MPTLAAPIAKLADDIHHDRFGGSAEMVDAAVAAVAAAARESQAPSARALAVELEAWVDAILEVMPSIAPMTNLLHRLMARVQELEESAENPAAARESTARAAEAYRERQTAALDRIARTGAQLIRAGDRVATYSTSGTVWRMFKQARAEGKTFEVVVTEARPANEGRRTLRDTVALGIPVTFAIDAVLGPLLRGCALAVIGADVITSTGEVLAKVGSYLEALVAREYGIPFYVAADTTKFDPLTLEGFPLKVHDAGAEAVWEGSLPLPAQVLNPTFELVPARLVTGIITEVGIVPPGSVAALMRAANLSPRLVDKLYRWAR